MIPQASSKVGSIRKISDRVQTRIYLGHVNQRTGNPVRQAPGAGSGHGFIDHGQKRSRAFALLGAVDFEAGACRRVNRNETGCGSLAWRGQTNRIAGLGQSNIINEGASGADLGGGKCAEPVQAFDIVSLEQAGFTIAAVKFCFRERGQGFVEHAQ